MTTFYIFNMSCNRIVFGYVCRGLKYSSITKKITLILDVASSTSSEPVKILSVV